MLAFTDTFTGSFSPLLWLSLTLFTFFVFAFSGPSSLGFASRCLVALLYCVPVSTHLSFFPSSRSSFLLPNLSLYSFFRFCHPLLCLPAVRFLSFLSLRSLSLYFIFTFPSRSFFDLFSCFEGFSFLDSSRLPSFFLSFIGKRSVVSTLFSLLSLLLLFDFLSAKS